MTANEKELIITNCQLSDLEDVINFVKNNEYLLPQPISSVTSISDYMNKLINLGFIKVLRVEGEICGIAAGYANDKRLHYAHLQLILLSSYNTNKGYGSKLMHSFIMECINLGMNTLILTCDKCNVKALNFYKNFGLLESKIKHINQDKIYLQKAIYNE